MDLAVGGRLPHVMAHECIRLEKNLTIFPINSRWIKSVEPHLHTTFNVLLMMARNLGKKGASQSDFYYYYYYFSPVVLYITISRS
jgi:hypothetical protein